MCVNDNLSKDIIIKQEQQQYNLLTTKLKKKRDMETKGSVKHLYWRDLEMISSEGNSNVAPQCSFSGFTTVKNEIYEITKHIKKIYIVLGG